MSKLEKMLLDWVSNDLITSEQSKQITAHERARPANSWVLYGFLMLGAIIIGIGVISLIAANWRNIPDTLKLIIDFLLLISLAIGSYRAHQENKPILFEVLLISFMIFCLASIGLISQIYHTGGKPYQALLFWSIITTGVAAISNRYITPFFWTTGFFLGLITAAFLSPILKELGFKPIFVLMAVPLLSSLFAIICRIIGGEGPQTRALRSWTVIAGLIILVNIETMLPRLIPSDLTLIVFLPGYVLAALSAIGIWMTGKYKKAQKILLLFSIILYLVPFHLPLFEIKSKLVYAICTLSVISTEAIFLASLKHRRLFQCLLVVLGLRFLVLYFQALGGLALTGFGLIISGIIIISVVVAWNKYRQKITLWAEGLVK